MKKALLILIPLLLVTMAGGAIWWRYMRPRDPYTLAQQMIDKGDLAAAQVALRMAVRTNPQNIPAHFRLGMVSLRQGDPVAAEKELRFARDAGFDAHTINPLLAQAYLSQGHYTELLRDFPAEGLPPDEAVQILTVRALAQLGLNNRDAALASVTEAERVAPNSADAALAFARIALARHDIDTAIKKVNHAIELNPRSTEALLLNGQLLTLNGDRTHALAAFDAALKLAPNLVPARLERANALLAGGNNAAAKEDIDAALKLDPRNPFGLYLRGALLTTTKDYAGADAALTRIAAVLASFPRGYYYQAIEKFNLGQAEQAAEAATRFLARHPGDPDAIKLFASVELAAQRTTRAIQVLTKAVNAGGADWDMLDLLGRAYSLAGRPDQAIQYLQLAATLAPNNADILTRLAAIRMTVGDAAHATGDLEHALTITPGDPGASAALIAASIANGNLDKAALELDALRKSQGNTEAIGNLAGLLKQAQLDIDGAYAAFSDVVAHFPDAVEPRINLAKVLVLQGKNADAQRVLGEVLQRQPANAAALGAMVTLLLADGNATRAVALAEAAHGAAPKDPSLTVGLITLYIRTNQAPKALGLLDQALRDQPGDAALLSAKAQTQIGLGDVAGARDTLRQMLQRRPDDVATRQVLANLLAGSGDMNGAKKVIEDGLAALPGDAALLQADVALVLRAQGLDAALDTADQLAAVPYNRAGGKFLRGNVYLAAGKFADAAAFYAAQMKTDSSSELALRLAVALNAAGNADQSAQVLRDWLAGHPADTQAATALASLDIRARRFYDAETHLRVVLTQQPNNASALNNLAWVYQQRGDTRAQPTAQKAYLIQPSPQAADTLGWILTARGPNPVGLTLLRQAAALLHGDPTVTYHLAVALKQAGQRDEAIATLQPILQAPSNFDDRNAAVALLQDLTASK